MAGESKIEWTTATWNPWIGCQKVSPGCVNCYAEADQDTRRGRARWGSFEQGGTRSLTSDSTWHDPYRWRAGYLRRVEDWKADGSPEGREPDRPRVFLASLSDVFEDWRGGFRDHNGFGVFVGADGLWYSTRAGGVGEVLRINDVRARMFKVIRECPELDWLLLTKRPANVIPAIVGAADASDDSATKLWLYDWIGDGAARPPKPPAHVWLGVSVEDQPRMGRAEQLLAIPAARRFVSAEPLLGPLDFRHEYGDGAYRDLLTGLFHNLTVNPTGGGTAVVDTMPCEHLPRLDLVIAGGESGRGSRGCDVEWVRLVVERCRAAGVACFVKQLGGNPVRCTGPAGSEIVPLGLLQKKGNDPAEWPDDLRVRQLPTSVTR